MSVGKKVFVVEINDSPVKLSMDSLQDMPYAHHPFSIIMSRKKNIFLLYFIIDAKTCRGHDGRYLIRKILLLCEPSFHQYVPPSQQFV
jgi:hypothetical protein